jgi:lysyl endopeptidase
MKKIALLFFGIIVPTLLFSQQPFNQHSLGGKPWMFKFNQTNAGINFIEMPAFDLNQALADDSVNNLKGRSYRFGYDHLVDYTLNNSGTWTQLESGDYMWTLGIRSAGAMGMSVSFANVHLPQGCKLYVMNSDHTEFHGAFDETFASDDTRMMATEQLGGESIVIELFVPENLRNLVSLDLYRVTHAYRDMLDMARSFGQAGNCENNARCPAYAAHDNQIRSVVCLVNGGEFCSGALINNTCNDGKAFVLTANHCGTTPGGWTFRFNWEAPGCPNPGSSPSSNSITGGTFRAAWDGSDFFLCEITAAGAPATLATFNVYYAGWDRNTTAATNPFGIHHPSGDIKKFSQSTGTATAISINFNTNPSTAMWQTPTWTDGVTEPGSSGSPLFNSSGQIIGQLGGGPSDCTCENNAGCGFDYYGRLSVSWAGNATNSTRLSNWLDPAACATGATTLNGYDPNTPSLTYDAQLQSITSPNGTLCTGPYTPVVVIKNNGTTTLTSMTINFQIDGGAATGVPWSGSLLSGASTNFNMTGITIAAGAHTYAATIVAGSLNGANADLNTANNALTSNYTGVAAVGVSLPFTEGFESVTFPPTNWTNQNPDANVGSALWVRTTTCSGFGASTACAKIDQYTPGTTTAGQLDNLITPYLDLTTQGTPLNLTFAVANCRYDATFYDSLIVWISTDCSASWTRLASYGNNTGANQLTTGPDFTASAFVPTAAQWATKTISLNAYAAQTKAQIRFQLKSGYGQNTFIDDVNISGSPLAPPVASFTLNDNTACVGQTVTYTNTSTGATSFSWTFPGGSPGSGTTSPINVSYSTPGTYTTTLTATNAFGTNSSTQTITVSANPTNTASNAGPYCPGNTIQLNATGGAIDYDWTGPNAYVQNNTQNPTIAGATTAMGGVYTVTVTNAAGCTATATTTVTVNSNPTPTATNTGPYCPGGTIQLNSPTGSATDDWTGPNSYVQNNSQNPTIPGATLAMDGVYTVTVTNGSGCSATATTTVIVVNPSSATASNGGPYCVGQTINLSSLAGGTGYAWTGPASYANATQNPSIASSTVAMTGVYSVTITFTGGCTSSATTTVTVNPLPTVNVSSFGTVCSTYAPVTLTGGTPAGGVYSGTAVSAGQFNPTTAGVGTFNITYTYTDGNNCSNNAVAQIVVDPCAGIEDPSAASILVYPNPTTQIIYITGLTEGMHSYAIISTIGQVIQTGNLNGDGSIDMGIIANGTYYLKIDERYWKMIKQ